MRRAIEATSNGEGGVLAGSGFGRPPVFLRVAPLEIIFAPLVDLALSSSVRRLLGRSYSGQRRRTKYTKVELKGQDSPDSGCAGFACGMYAWSWGLCGL